MKNKTLFWFITTSILLLNSIQISAQILSERNRADMRDEILADRFNNLLPDLMDDTNIDMWLV
ncbi:MAG: hypothetical protein ACJA1Z_004008, partial [Patiriisocius sp.]